jgi:hypothetical protein
MLHRLTKALVVLALTVSLSAPWTFLQSIAWTGMLYSYTKEAGFSRAVSMTFDGEHPCPLCKAIEKGRAQEREQDGNTTRPSEELKLDLPIEGFAFHHPPHPAVPSYGFNRLGVANRAPEPPPPRLS